MDQHRVGRPGPSRREQAHGVEVPRGNEVHVAARGRNGEPRGHVPRREADLARVGLGRERIVVEPEPSHDGERRQTVGLPQDLPEQRGGIAAARGEQDLHSRAKPADRVAQGHRLE